MEDSEIEATVREIVVKNARFPLRSLGPDDVLGGATGFDSLSLVRALAELEKRLGIRIPDESLEELTEISFGRLVEIAREEIAREQATRSRG